MKVRITESSRGGYLAQIGDEITEHRNPIGAGYIMAGFIETESKHCATMQEAKKWAERKVQNEYNNFLLYND